MGEGAVRALARKNKWEKMNLVMNYLALSQNVKNAVGCDFDAQGSNLSRGYKFWRSPLLEECENRAMI